MIIAESPTMQSELTTRLYTSIKRPVVEPDWTPEPIIRAQGGLPDLAMLGINFTGRCYEDWRWHNSTGYLNILTRYHHSAFLNLTGAEQYNEARARASDVRGLMPRTGILWRHMKHTPPGASGNTDRGLWRLAVHEYVDNVVLAHGTADYYNVTDCEGHIDRHEMKTYAAMEAQRLDYGVPKGARFAVLRMSTHNPLPEILDSGDLDELLKAIGRNMGHWDDPKVVISNNGYFDDTANEDGLLTARRIEQRCMTKFGFRPIIVMGEYGFDKGFTSEQGWRVSGINGAQMVSKVIDHTKHIAGMAACVYGVGFTEDAKVKHFHLGNAELELVMKLSPVYAPPGPIVILPPEEEEPPVTTPPAPEIGWTKARLNVGFYTNSKPKGLNIRSSTSTASDANIVAKVTNGDTVFYKKQPVEKTIDYLWLHVKTVNDVEGVAALLGVPVETSNVQMYIDQQFIAIEESPPPPPPDPDPDPEPPKPPTDREYAEELIALHKREQAAYAELAACADARANLVQSILERTNAT